MNSRLKWSAAAAAGLMMLVALTGCPTQLLPTWMKHVGGEADDGAYAVAGTRDGGSIVAGFTEAEEVADDNALLVKLNARGREVWRAEYGDERQDAALAVAVALDGGYVIAGRFGGDSDSSSDGFLLKTDRDGKEEWRRLLDGGGHDYATSVVPLAGGGYLVGLEYDLFGTSRAVMVKTDGSGTPLWEASAGEHTHVARAIATADGGAALGWWEVAPGDKAGAFVGAVAMLKTDAAGAEQWRKVLPDTEVAELEDLQQTADGGYILTGEFDLMSTDSQIFLWKLDATGSVSWQQALGIGVRDRAHRVRQTEDGGYLLAGAMQPADGRNEFFLVKTDALGQDEWLRAFGGDDSDAAYDVVERAGGYLAVGLGESFEEEGEAENKQIVVVKADRFGHARNGERELPAPPGVEPDYYEMLSFKAATHQLTPAGEDANTFTLTLNNVADSTTVHRVSTAAAAVGNAITHTVSESAVLWPVSTLAEHWEDMGFEADPPEAGLLMGYNGTEPELMFVRLKDPQYNGEAKSLRFTVETISETTAPELALVDEGLIVEGRAAAPTYLFVAERNLVQGLTNATFAAAATEAKGGTAVLFVNPDSEVCKQVLPRYQELSMEVGGIRFYTVDLEANAALGQAQGVKNAPTLCLYKDGALTATVGGAGTKVLMKDALVTLQSTLDD